MSEFYDCHGGPGTTEEACGACVTCLHRVIEGLESERDALSTQLERADEEAEVHKERIKDLRDLVQEYRQYIRPGDLANLREEQA